MEDILQEISDGDLEKLRDSFKKDWPYAIQAYFFLDNWITWKKKKKDVGVLFTAPNGDWSNGTFVAITTDYFYSIFFFTMEKSSKRLINALKNTKRIDWQKGPFISLIHEKIDEECMEIIRNVNGSIAMNELYNCWYFSKKISIHFDVSYPDGFYAAPLEPKDGPIINSTLILRFSDDENYVPNIIAMNGGLGIYEKNSNKLCAFLLQNDFGEIGMLHTLKKNKNLATLLLMDYTKRRAKMGLDSFGLIAIKNSRSQNVAINVGAVVINKSRSVKFVKSEIKSNL